MHAGTEQLLAIRDGDPVDAVIAAHAANCDVCRDQLIQLCEMREVLRGMPQLDPPAGAWTRLTGRLDEPVQRRHRWLRGAVAAAAVVAVGFWLWGNDDAPQQNGRVALTMPQQLAPSRVETGAAELDRLVSRSRQLEQLLRELNDSTPQVMNAGTAGTIAGLQDGIAYIDYGLSYNEQLDPSQSEQLWRQRVGLMNTLVQVRGAQLQQISN